jgi:hypothetical protein
VQEKPADRHVLDRPEGVGRRPELGEVDDQRIVEAEPALVAQLQNGRSGERLGDRGDAVERPLVRAGCRRKVGEAGARGPGQVSVTNDPYRRARQAMLADEAGD